LNGKFESPTHWIPCVYKGQPGDVIIANGALTIRHSTRNDWCSIGQNLAGRILPGNYVVRLRYRTTNLGTFSGAGDRRWATLPIQPAPA